MIGQASRPAVPYHPEDDPRFNVPADFFTQPVPKGSRAIFSTINGNKPMRTMVKPNPTSRHPVWEPSKILNFCNGIRSRFSPQCKYLQPLQAWSDLYQYFDAYDIQLHGAWNLWNVIHRIISENQHLLEGLKQSTIPEFDAWVIELIQDEDRRNRLRAWNPDVQSDILDCFYEDELSEIEGMESFYLPTIRNILWNYHIKLCNGSDGRAPSDAPTSSPEFSANTPQSSDESEQSIASSEDNAQIGG